MSNRIYIAIDLKSFYASVECVERGLNPLTTNLVVADAARTEKTICLAVSPSLKAYGIPGRPRLFEVVQRIKQVNNERKRRRNGQDFDGSSFDADELKSNKNLAVDYITAVPRMAYYMEYSSRIYDIYLKYVAPEDMHVYSVDEVFMDVTDYLQTYKMTPKELTKTILNDVLHQTGITATAGIGTNMYLSKIAMDIVAKHMEPDEAGVRIAELDEMSYRRQLWNHRPLTDFWRIGKGYSKKLEENGLFTMGDVARCSLGGPLDYYNPELLYKLFGINAELLIDHAWGWEPCTIKEVQSYVPESESLSTGQVLQHPYNAEKGKLIVREMTDLLVLDLVDKKLVTDQMVLTIGYDIENVTDEKRRKQYHGEVTIDRYGREVPKHAHGSINLMNHTSSTKLIMDAVMELYDRIIDHSLLIRRVTVVANHTLPEDKVQTEEMYEQMNLFTDFGDGADQKNLEAKKLEREKKMQHAILDIQKKYGKNAILKGMNLEEGAMTVQRNSQIGGHKA